MSIEFQEAPSLPAWLEAEYPFNRRVAVVEGRRVHFVDEGSGPPVLLLHGHPVWSFVWRKVIPPLISEGMRVIAPDLIGLGLSDKPRKPTDHTLKMHTQTVSSFVQALDL